MGAATCILSMFCCACFISKRDLLLFSCANSMVACPDAV